MITEHFLSDHHFRKVSLVGSHTKQPGMKAQRKVGSRRSIQNHTLTLIKSCGTAFLMAKIYDPRTPPMVSSALTMLMVGERGRELGCIAEECKISIFVMSNLLYEG